MLHVITLNNNIKLKQFLYLRIYKLKQVHERCESCALDNCSATAAEKKKRPISSAAGAGEGYNTPTQRAQNLRKFEKFAV